MSPRPPGTPAPATDPTPPGPRTVNGPLLLLGLAVLALTAVAALAQSGQRPWLWRDVDWWLVAVGASALMLLFGLLAAASRRLTGRRRR